MINIVLFGPPGAGKGTQAIRLATTFNLYHLSTGDVFRSNIKLGSELGKLASSYLDKGALVPDEVTIDLLISEIDKHPNAAGFIFDGFPRTEAQATALDKILEKRGTRIAKTIALDVDEEELKQRLIKRAVESGRSDDADPNIVQNRILVYLSETFPVKAFYNQQGKLLIISGHGTIDEITKRLEEEINKIAK